MHEFSVRLHADRRDNQIGGEAFSTGQQDFGASVSGGKDLPDSIPKDKPHPVGGQLR